MFAKPFARTNWWNSGELALGKTQNLVRYLSIKLRILRYSSRRFLGGTRPPPSPILNFLAVGSFPPDVDISLDEASSSSSSSSFFDFSMSDC